MVTVIRVIMLFILLGILQFIVQNISRQSGSIVNSVRRFGSF